MNKKMGYTALEKMKEKNKREYNLDNAPIIPEAKKESLAAKGEKKPISDLEKAVQSFIRNRCENLFFSEETECMNLEDRNGTSIKKGQIPYNMEMDLNRLCLENAIHRFLESGMEHDAFDVYYCYLEMFIGNYGKSRKMIETLAEFESNASSLLLKHRDHYTHSVYVFLIGIAVYETNDVFRKQYQDFYHLKGEQISAYHFIKYWGLTSLFHDIGYPFEIPFEQVKSYFGKEGKDTPFISYKNMEPFIDITKIDADAKLWEKLMLGEEKSRPKNLNDILAHNTAFRLKDNYEGYKDYYKYSLQNPEKGYQDYLAEEVLKNKPEHPEKFGKFMDHAYFSAILLFRQLIEVIGIEKLGEDAECYMDSLTAIMLHNSLYKFSITNYKSEYNKGHEFEASIHPLAYLLMLADELQCWDRTSYGLNSRSEVHAMDCELKFEGTKISAKYIFDHRLEDKAKNKSTKGTYKKLVTPTAERPEFLTDIEQIIHINDGADSVVQLEVSSEFREDDRFKKKYLSDSNFIHLYDFAIALNARYAHDDNEIKNLSREQLIEEFQVMSLEYKLSNINQAKEFAKYLDKIGCFYTDQPVVFDLVENFSKEDMKKIGPMEHERWLREHADMGWQACERETFAQWEEKYGKQEAKQIRELTRCHINMMDGEITEATARAHYEHDLTDDERELDTKPMDKMLKLVDIFDGLRIYRISKDGN